MWLLISCIKAVVKFLGMKSVISKIGHSEVGTPFLSLAGHHTGSPQEGNVSGKIISFFLFYGLIEV